MLLPVFGIADWITGSGLSISEVESYQLALLFYGILLYSISDLDITMTNSYWVDIFCLHSIFFQREAH